MTWTPDPLDSDEPFEREVRASDDYIEAGPKPFRCRLGLHRWPEDFEYHGQVQECERPGCDATMTVPYPTRGVAVLPHHIASPEEVPLDGGLPPAGMTRQERLDSELRFTGERPPPPVYEGTSSRVPGQRIRSIEWGHTDNGDYVTIDLEEGTIQLRSEAGIAHEYRPR